MRPSDEEDPPRGEEDHVLEPEVARSGGEEQEVSVGAHGRERVPGEDVRLAAEPDDTMPPTRPVRISISELARRFSVSRPHVLRLLRDATAAGLIERAGTTLEAMTLLLPPLSVALRQSVSIVFLFFAHCARAALAEIDGEQRIDQSPS